MKKDLELLIKYIQKCQIRSIMKNDSAYSFKWLSSICLKNRQRNFSQGLSQKVDIQQKLLVNCIK
ncbi:unnamed protein product (macronuclear) [Paramecium tetraurelia]|uniref:Uncharacterized protein n=1 Tax=Paramecium tetraurelia TaxID=5888 RepID=A0BE99_PARTE|nr:uncharacterized protein GSPATT00027899001 [Paramecium tetraurelia]CAK56866.1 unnamed protein product [Paramecium tetraurelia]|eukprot:XP_001424264.1 hypothetical protein (macronuclear) [Paramecium tetraurelia strain d4-2]